MLAAGHRIDRYTVEAELGEGGMATVYRVRHTALGSLHALKILKVQSRGIAERLMQEGRTQATLRHPNIVAVTDVIEVAGAPGLVLEYVAGPTLETWLRVNRPSMAVAEALFLGIVAGVARAHRHGVVHRDLKPGNVLLDEGDEGLVPKVTDFGLVKALVEEGSASRTRSGVAMGTPAYMAPEQIRDAKTVDARADVFALGCILYELVYGEPAFTGADTLAVMNAIVAGEYRRPDVRDPAVPERLRAAIVGCLASDREARIPDCAALRRVVTGGVGTGTSFPGAGATPTPASTPPPYTPPVPPYTPPVVPPYTPPLRPPTPAQGTFALVEVGVAPPRERRAGRQRRRGVPIVVWLLAAALGLAFTVVGVAALGIYAFRADPPVVTPPDPPPPDTDAGIPEMG